MIEWEPLSEQPAPPWANASHRVSLDDINYKKTTVIDLYTPMKEDGNVLVRHRPPVPSEVAVEPKDPRAAIAIRIETCKACPELNALNFCRQCGCFMPAKVRIKSVSCPIGKWGRET